MREKLIELFEGSLRYAGDVCGETGDCSKCQYDKCGSNCGYAIRADYFIANGVTIAKWIAVTERLPKVDETVLVRDRVTGEVTTAHLNEFNSFVFRDGRGHGASYWMPLPEPPKGE